MTSITPLMGSLPSTRTVNNETTTEKDLQTVFSAVLREVGRDGYASVETSADESELEGRIESSWEAWFEQVSNTRYTFVAGAESPSVREGKTAEDLKRDYKAILSRAYREGGYQAPLAFLQNLSPEELKTVQQVQHLADSIQPTGLSEEAALNLLIPPAAQVDSNADGFTSVGRAQTVRFPDSRTPAKVRDAWEEATASLTEGDKLMYVLQISRIGLITETENDYPTPAVSVDSFEQKANQWLEYLDYFKAQIPLEQYERDHRFWTEFRTALQREDVTQ